MAWKTSQLDLRIGEVILKNGSVWTEKFKVKVFANQEKSLSDIATLIENVFLLNFLHELLMRFLIRVTAQYWWVSLRIFVLIWVGVNVKCINDYAAQEWAMIRNCTYLLPNIIQTYTMNIELTPMTEFKFRVDPHSNIWRHMNPRIGNRQ